MFKVIIFTIILALWTIEAQSQVLPAKCKSDETSYGLPCLRQELDLVDKKILIKIFTKSKPGTIIDRTFVVVHANEEKGLDAAKKVISENYGRLVEIVSKSSTGINQRYLYFGANNENCIDPNRIYTKKGIRDNLVSSDKPCSVTNATDTLVTQIDDFAKKFLKIVTNNNTHAFIIGVHNNDDSLSLNDWSKGGDVAKTAFGIFRANDHLQNDVFDTGKHNFVLATNGNLFGKLLDKGIYFVALQENREYLTKPLEGTQKRILKENLDDGSMSIYFGSTLFGNSGKPFNYLIVEAGGKTNFDGNNDINKEWQKKTLKSVININLKN